MCDTSRGRNHWLLSGCLIVSAVASAGRTQAADDRIADRQSIAAAIRRANRDNHNSLDSVTVRYSRDLVDVSSRAGSELSLALAPYVLTWAKSGRREVLFSDPQFDYGRKWGRRWLSWDGRRSMHATFFRHNPQQMSVLDHESCLPPPFVELSACSLALGRSLNVLGMRSLRGLSLVSVLEQAPMSGISTDTRVLGDSETAAEESPAIRWELHECVNPVGQPLRVVAWFDEQRDWLPRKWELQHLGDADGSGEDRPPYFSITVLRFRQVRDPLRNALRWFPDRMVLASELRTYEVIVHNAVINGAVDESLFEPPVSEGTELLHDHGTVRQVRTWVGGEQGQRLNRRLHEREMAFLGISDSSNAAEFEGDSSGAAAGATAADGREIGSWLALIGAVLALVPVLIWRWRRPRGRVRIARQS